MIILAYLNIIWTKPWHSTCYSCSLYTARIVKNCLSEKNIDILVWPGSSPELNVIENCWTVLNRMVAARHSASMDDLIKAIREVWVTEITERYCENLSKSNLGSTKNRDYPIKY